MAFFKTSSPMKITFSEEIKSSSDWQLIRNNLTPKVAKSIENITEKFSKTKKNFIIGGIDTDNYRYDHVTILHSINLEDNGYWITPETQRFINSNNDCWETNDLREDAYSFVGGKDRNGDYAKVFEEHNQDPKLAKGKVIDLVVRELPETKTIAIELLIGTNKKHEDLIDNINRGYYNGVSMGCTVEYCVCTICGNEAEELSQYCNHIKSLKPINGTSICSDGKIRKVAEICKHSKFYDCSWVHNPADESAFHQNVVATKIIKSENKKVASNQGLLKLGFMENQFNKMTDIVNFASDNNFPSSIVNKLGSLNNELSRKAIKEIFSNL